ncbi:MAG: TonB-dependent siderophore receptor, partial [Pseudomonadota bacterium]
SSNKLEEIIVIGTRQSRYIVNAIDATTGLDLDFLENPRNVVLIPEQLILDRKITDLSEALRVVPNFAEGDGAGNVQDDYFLRGFQRRDTYRNGFRRIGGTRTNMTNVEYTQVIRGPASITYGQVEPGGLVDVITKKPLAETRISAEVRYGTYDDRLALADWSQLITEAAAVRLVASTHRANSFRDFTNIERDSASLTGRIDLSDNTRWDLGYEWQKEKRPLDRGTITIPTSTGLRIVNDVTDVPLGRRFGEPFEEQDSTFHFFETTITHQFNNQWNGILTAAYEENDSQDLQARPEDVFIYAADAAITDDGFFTGVAVPKPIYDDPTDRIFLERRVDGNRNKKTEVKYLDGMLRGEFDTGPVNHRLAVGFNYRDGKASERRFNGETSNGVTIPLFNIQQPIYGELSDNVDIDLTTPRSNQGEDLGIFINDYLTLTERLGLLLGVRYSETDFEGGADSKADAWTPQIGISYRVGEHIALVASYSESFLPNFSLPLGDEVIEPDPEEGEQIEVGIKGQWLDGRLESTLVAFQIEKKNVFVGFDRQFNPILAEGQTSDGIELTVVGQPVPGMNVTAAYGYLDSELDDGNRPSEVPRHTFQAYASYEVQAGTLEGLGAGAGVFYSGNRFGTVDNDWKLGSYVVADTSVWYTLAAPKFFGREAGTVRLQFAVKNVFDEEYFAGAGNDLRINVGMPRTYIGSVSFAL